MEKVWWLLFVLFNLCVVFRDLRWRRVPNALLLTALVAQLAWLAARPAMAEVGVAGAHGWADAAAGFILGLAFVLFWLWRRVMGAGDVKYLAVLGAVMGIKPLALALLLGSVLGIPHTLWHVLRLARQGRKAVARRGVPYAAYVALAALSVALMQWNLPWCSACSSWCCMGS